MAKVRQLDLLRDVVRRNRHGHLAAIPSVCSAQPDVIRASLKMARTLDRTVVIEATSNQVNQDGGYTGMRPSDFVAFVHGVADQTGVSREQVIFGGDHLGPQAWRARDADDAMSEAETLVREYVAAGFGKIHLDCSEGCADDPVQLDDEQTASRSARLARVCAQSNDDILFVVGTEVPPPGGARSAEDEDIPATTPSAARATLHAHDAAFGDLSGLIGGLVVQPGVEFGPTAVHHLPIGRDPGLRAALAEYPQICLEAHSTDYQNPDVFPRLAQLGFAFQKVGPALTYAYREALYALDQIRTPSGQLEAVMEDVMLADPSKWSGHAQGTPAAQYDQRHRGLADRIRYYWPAPAARQAIHDLLASHDDPIPDATLQAHFDASLLDQIEAGTGPLTERIIDAHIQLALRPYFFEEAA